MTQTRLGVEVPGWTPPVWPGGSPMQGRYARLEALHADTHAAIGFEAPEVA